MSVVVRDTHDGGLPPCAPVRPDGHRYRFEVVASRVRVYGDTADDLVGAFVPGYDQMDRAGRLAARIGWAVRAQTDLQAAVNDWHGTSGCSPEQTAVLYGGRSEPLSVAVWDCPVPLVLVDVYYRPDGPLPRPVGEHDTAREDNLIWLSPADPYDFLVSLHSAGVLHMSEAKETA